MDSKQMLKAYAAMLTDSATAKKRGQTNVMGVIIGIVLGFLVIAFMLFAGIIFMNQLSGTALATNDTSAVTGNFTSFGSTLAGGFPVIASILILVLLIAGIGIALFYLFRFAGGAGKQQPL